MKKIGFTITELLITLGIIGVAAALAAPAISNIMPDKNKAMFLKNYNELVTITEKMLDDKELYYQEYAIAGEDGVDIDNDGEIDVQPGIKYATCIGLACVGRPLKQGYDKEEYEDAGKYQNLCRNFLGGTPINGGAWFRTPDNTIWSISNFGIDHSNDVDIISNDDPIYFIVNTKSINDTSTACSYRDSCKKPSKFVFDIDSYGNITPDEEDYLARAYLLNPNYNNKRKDLACAAALKADPSRTDCADVEEE